MSTIIIVINIFAISIVLFSFINFNLSIALYIAYLILVPGLEYNIAGLVLSYNFVNTLLIIVFLYNFSRHGLRLNWNVVTPFLFLYLLLLILSLFTRETPYEWMLNYWRGSFMQTCILPFIIWNNARADRKSLIYIKWALIVSVFVAGMYGLFLTQMEGENPYTSTLSGYFGIRDAADLYAAENVPRLGFSTAGKIQSTMEHPMTWALLLCFSLVTMIIFYNKTKHKLHWFLIAVILFNILISGVRTAIAAFAITSFYFLIRYRRFKLIVSIIVLLFSISIVVKSDEDLSNLFNSFIDVSGQKSEVSGSSIPMRLAQFKGVENEIKGNEFTGKGFGWTSYYQSTYGEHPVLLAFESLLFVVLCNSGYLGILIWAVFTILLFRIQRQALISKIDIYSMDAMSIVYLSYAIGTGEYEYMKFFAIFYSFLLSYLYINQKQKDGVCKNV